MMLGAQKMVGAPTSYSIPFCAISGAPSQLDHRRLRSFMSNTPVKNECPF